MKAAIYEGGKKIVIRDVDRPVLNNNEVLIRVEYCGICGSDLFVCSGNHPRVQPPTIIGHEFSGVIAEINSFYQNLDLEIGDRVAVRPTYPCGRCEACKKGLSNICRKLALIGIDTDGGFAEYVKVPLDNVIKVSDQVDYDEIAMVEPLAVAVHAVSRSSIKIGDKVLVLGGGPIGLLIASVLKIAGASQIIVSEINPYRLEKVRTLGFTAINPQEEDIFKEVEKITNGIGVDLLFDAVGVPITAKQSAKLVKIQGEIIIVGVFEEPAEFDFLSFMNKEQRAIGVRVYTEDDVKKAVELLENKQLDVKPLISHILKLEDILEGFKMIQTNARAMKILVTPKW